MIEVKVKDVADLENAKEELHSVMRRIRRLAPGDPDDFAINQQEQILEMVHKVTAIIGGIGLFITGLSLFVGGIGIMNIMFVSVAERTREIGIRKAIGAKRRTILLQFLIEAATICLIGGAIGLGIAWPLTLVMQQYMPASTVADRGQPGAARVAGDGRGVGLCPGLARRADEPGGCAAEWGVRLHAPQRHNHPARRVPRELPHGPERRGRAQAALRPDAAGGAGRRVLHHRRDDGHAGDAEQRRSRAQPTGRPDLHGAEVPTVLFSHAGRPGKDPAAEEHHAPGRPAVAGGRHAGARRRRGELLLGRPDPNALQADRARRAPLWRDPRQFPRPQLDRAGRTRHRRRRRGGRPRRVRARQQPGPDHLPHRLSRRRAGEDRRHELHRRRRAPAQRRLAGRRSGQVRGHPHHHRPQPLRLHLAQPDHPGPGPRPRELRRLRRGGARPAAHHPQSAARRAG